MSGRRAARRRAALRLTPLAVCAVLGLLVATGVLAARGAGGFESLELSAYDWFLSHRPAAGADPRIVLITVSESDIRTLGRWPIADATAARVLQTLAGHGARAIGLDIYRDVPVPPGTDELQAVLRAHPAIIAVMKFGEREEDGIPPPPALRGTERVGFNDILVDAGGIVRRGLLFLDDGTTTHTSFALRLALRYLEREGTGLTPDPREPERLRLGSTTVAPLGPTDGGYVAADTRGYQLLLDYGGAGQPFRSFPLTALLDGAVDAAEIRDRIVLVGVDAEGVKDFFYTPRSRHGGGHMPGVALHAHITSQLLRLALDAAAPIRSWRDWQEAVWVALWAMAGALLAFRFRSPWQLSLLTAAGMLAVAGAGFVAFWRAWWVPVVPPSVAFMAAAGVVTAYMSYQQRQERQLLMHLFSRHVSPELAEEIWRQREDFLDGGRPRPQRMIVTVLFTDLVGFTNISEKRSPAELVDWVNAYMEAMVAPITAHGGVINKYMGDSIMAMFGVPLARTTEDERGRDAVNAVRCALAMDRQLVALNRRWREEGEPTVGMRVGIFTGPVVSGSIGSASRLEYTVLGDTVNTASRLESFDKDLYPPDFLTTASRILVGASTLAYLHDVRTEPVGEVHLKGKEDPVKVYRVLGLLEDPP